MRLGQGIGQPLNRVAQGVESAFDRIGIRGLAQLAIDQLGYFGRLVTCLLMEAGLCLGHLDQGEALRQIFLTFGKRLEPSGPITTV